MLFINMRKLPTNTRKILISIKNYNDLSIRTKVIFIGWQCHKLLPINGFTGIENTSQSNKDFIESNNEDSDEGYFLKIHVECTENLLDLNNDLLFLPEII